MPKTSRLELLADELRQRLEAHNYLLPFAQYTHHNWKTGEHHVRICEALERVERGECKRLAIFAPPRHGKSELASIRFPAWFLGRNPDKQIITTSYNETLATDFGRLVRNLVEQPDYRNVFPGVTLSPDSQASGRWHTNAGGAYVAVGLGGTLTGRGMSCVAAGTLVVSSRGLVPIDQLTTDDFVLTHKNRFRRVLAVVNMGARETVEISGNGMVLECTDDHNLLTPGGWNEAKKCKTVLGLDLQKLHEWKIFGILQEEVQKTAFSVNKKIHSFLHGMRKQDRIVDTPYRRNETERHGVESDRALSFVSHNVSQTGRIKAQIVYDIQVEEDCSFVAGGFVAHNCGIIDDPVKNREEADSERIRDSIWKWYTSTFYTRLMPEGSIVLMCTRWHEDDLAGRALQSENWEVLELPAIEDEGRPNERPLWPEWFGLGDLKAKRDVISTRDWQALYQQTPVPAVGGIYRSQWWRYWFPPSMSPPRHVRADLEDGSSVDCVQTELAAGQCEYVFSWDLTFKNTTTSAYVVGQLWRRAGANSYLVDQVREKADFPTTISLIRSFTAKHRGCVGPILIEDKANGPAVISVLQAEIPGIIAINPEGGKEARANASSHVICSGNVYLPHPAIAPWVDEFVTECTKFPTGTYADQVDTMTQFLVYSYGKPIAEYGYQSASSGSGVMGKWKSDSQFGIGKIRSIRGGLF